MTKSLPDAEISVTKIVTNESYGLRKTFFEISVINKGPGQILRPINTRIYGYDVDSPNIGGARPIGARFSDSFGNVFMLVAASPEFFGSGTDSKGIRPGETENFRLQFSDTPVQNSSYVILSLDPQSLGQKASVAFRLPAEVFFGSPAVIK